MRQETAFDGGLGIFLGPQLKGAVAEAGNRRLTFARRDRFELGFSREKVVGLILVVALFSFELFNFDTTQFALGSLLGEASFLGLRWATILAVAFGAIDFAGLAYLFAPERSGNESREVWYLMGAWLLGATMNALMTWWSVSLSLLSHDFGNEVLNRQQLLEIVPVLVAILVWVTRILFIGAFSVAGDHLFGGDEPSVTVGKQSAAVPAYSEGGSRPPNRRSEDTTGGMRPERPGVPRRESTANRQLRRPSGAGSIRRPKPAGAYASRGHRR